MSDDQNLEIEEQEREEILEEIDKLVTSNRLPVSDDMEKLKPQKSGVAFPLVINLLAVAAVLSTFYFSSRLFEQKQETLTMENANYLSAEGKLLEELKKESAARLEEKDEEIGQIQNELEALDRQSRELIESMDQQIADREAELRIALEAELEEEREKLRAEGKSETDIEEELRRIEADRSAEYEAELAAFRTETEAAIAEKEEELARAKALNEELLAEVNSEKERIQSETKQRETELTAQFEAEKAALAEEAAAAEAELEKLTANQAKESLMIDQINSSYESIFNMLESDNTEAAIAQVEALRKLINDPAVASLKSVTARNANDRAMLDLIELRLEEQAYKEDVDITSLSAAADLLLSAQEIAALGTAAYRTGNFAEAEEYYSRSIEKIPALKQARDNLELIEKDIEQSRMSAMIAEGRSLEESGRRNEAAEQYAEAAKSAFAHNPELLEQAVSAVLGAAEAENSLQQTEMERRLSEKDEEIASLKKEIDEEITRLETQLEKTEADYASQISALNIEWEDRLLTANSDFEATLAEAEAGYESRLLEAGTDLTTVEGEKNEEIERLTRLIGERDQENLRINAEREEALAALAEAEKTIEEGRAYIAELEESTAAEIAALKAAAENDSEGVRNATSAEIAAIQEEADAEIAGLQAELAEAESEYKALEEKYELLQTTAESRLKSSQGTGYSSGVTQGRAGAFQDVISFTDYLDGTKELDAEAEARISELSAEEALYADTIRRIQDLASAGTGSGTALIPVARNILIGTISYASGSRITIEPLSDIELETGMRVTIKRRERGQEEYYVTFGIITSVSEGRISARTDPAGTEPARSMDLVYITQ